MLYPEYLCYILSVCVPLDSLGLSSSPPPPLPLFGTGWDNLAADEPIWFWPARGGYTDHFIIDIHSTRLCGNRTGYTAQDYAGTELATQHKTMREQNWLALQMLIRNLNEGDNFVKSKKRKKSCKLKRIRQGNCNWYGKTKHRC